MLATTGGHTRAMFVLSVGAGIYEELVFRLAAFTVLNLLLLDVLGMRRFWAHLLIVAASSLLFASYHYLGDEAFHWRTFAFRTLAGAYFGLIFVLRGYGITAGTHAAYDLLIVSLRALAAG
jgi:membrane protease YdiL (CAAX protease family)